MQFKLPANTPADCISEQSAVLRLCPPFRLFRRNSGQCGCGCALSAGIPKQAADAAVQILPAAVRITAADAPHRLQPPIQTVDAIQRRDNMYLAATVDAAE